MKAFVGKAESGKKLADGGGLHLFITPAGGSTWRVKYRLDGKEKIYSIGHEGTHEAIARVVGGSHVSDSKKPKNN